MIRGTRDISTLNWLDAKRALTLSEAVIVPLGSTEQHGFCLPLDTDTAICMRACEDLCKKYNLYYYPIIPFGQTWSSSGHAGTVHINERILEDYVKEIVSSLLKWRPKRIVLYSFHNGNAEVIRSVQRFFSDEGTTIYKLDSTKLLDSVGKLLERPISGGVWHASEIEISLMMHLYPGSTFASNNHGVFGESKGARLSEIKWIHANPAGYYGDPSAASPELGEKVYAELFRLLCGQLDIVLQSESDGLFPKLVVLDLDGTLLTDDKKVTARVSDVLSRVGERSLIGLASGRYEKMISAIRDRIPNCRFSISCNGAMVFDYVLGKAVHTIHLEVETACSLLESFLGEGYSFTVYTDDVMYMTKGLDRARRKMEKVERYYLDVYGIQLSHVEINTAADITDKERVLKIVIYEHDDARIGQVYSMTDPYEVTLEPTGNGLLSITHGGVDKGAALQFIQQSYRINQKDTASFGDYVNDLSLYGKSGISVAMGNAAAENLIEANFITLSNEEDGVAAFLEKRCLTV